jgi:amino acid transporter
MSSHGALHRKLSSWGVLLLTLSCLSPVFSIYGAGSDVLVHAGTGAPVLFAVGIGAALVWAAVYAELGSAYPYAGGDYVGVGSVLGPWAGFVSLALWAATSPPDVAFLAKTLAVYVVALMPTVSATLVTFAALAAAIAVALLAVRTSAIITGLFLTIEMLTVLVLSAGLWHPAHGVWDAITHPRVVDVSGHWMPVALGALASGCVNAAFATSGGNQAIAFGEELVRPHRNMGRVILLAGLIGALTTALPVIGVVVGSANLAAILHSPAPFTAYVISKAGPVAGTALSAGVVLAIFNALIAQLMFTARLYFSFGRDNIFPRPVNRALSTVHGVSGAPRMATLLIGACSALCCLLDSHLLLVFIAGLVVYSLALVSCAVLVGRRRGLTGRRGHWRSWLFPLAPVLGLGLALAFAVADCLDIDSGRPGLIALGVVLAGALLWYHRVLKKRPGGWCPRLE